MTSYAVYAIDFNMASQQVKRSKVITVRPNPKLQKGLQVNLPKATTFRLNPKLQKGLTLLSQILKKPQNRLVNEAVEAFLKTRSAEVEFDLEQILKRVKDYRDKDPNFEAAIAAFVDAEASLGAEDPAEGHTQPNAGPAQTLVHKLLRS